MSQAATIPAATVPATTVPVLMYHQIAAAAEAPSRLAVSPGGFAGQLGRLHEAGFATLTAAGFAAALAAPETMPARPVVLTFDDGFADFHDRALPLLTRYGFTATLFVTTGWIQDAADPAGGRPGRMLSWSQIGEAADAGIEIGAHSHGHPELDQLPDGLLRRELRCSKAALEDRLGRPVPGMAYPFGYSSERVRRAVRDAGHEYACAVGNATIGESWDSLALPRLTVSRSTRPRTFDQILRGQRIPLIFVKDRLLTKGWSAVRRGRAIAGRAGRGEAGGANRSG